MLTGKEINPVKMYGKYHPKKNKNGELIVCDSQAAEMEAVDKLCDDFGDDVEEQSQSSDQEETARTSNVKSSQLHAKYLEVVGCKKRKVRGTGSYSKAFLHHVKNLSAKQSCSKARRMHHFCVTWDTHLRKWLTSHGDECPPEMPLVDDDLQDEDPDSQ
ncbi:unnamed protein product, partial [Cuscuta epithymum]